MKRGAEDLERHGLVREPAEARSQQHHLATHDGLTGLSNRSAFEANLQWVLAYARRNRKQIALFFVDLDGFKSVNDSLGHAVGDKILSEVGTRIRALVRTSDMAARIGGDQFIVMLQDLRRGADAMLVAQKFQDVLSQPFQLEDNRVQLSASIGITFFPDDGSDAELLIKNADAAMYHSKVHGKGGFRFFSPSMNEELQTRLRLEGRLRMALDQRQLLLYYQPIWKSAPRELIAAEALLRWREPGCGLRQPADFILVAEESGLIVPIGRWVLETACAEWQQRDCLNGQGLAIAVNLSARQLSERSIVATIKEILDKTDLSPSRLQLEITETAILPDEQAAGKILEELHEFGVGLTLDDFGTGHSSLSRLRQHPFDRVKIDRSFVKDLPASSKAAAFASAMLAMGQALGLSVVAEGVETEEQLDFLVENGCEEFQGYLLGRPVPPDEFRTHLTSGS